MHNVLWLKMVMFVKRWSGYNKQEVLLKCFDFYSFFFTLVSLCLSGPYNRYWMLCLAYLVCSCIRLSSFPHKREFIHMHTFPKARINVKIIWRVTYVAEINSIITIPAVFPRRYIIILMFSLKMIELPFCETYGLVTGKTV